MDTQRLRWIQGSEKFKVWSSHIQNESVKSQNIYIYENTPCLLDVLIIKSNLWQKDWLISLYNWEWIEFLLIEVENVSHSQHPAGKSNRWKIWLLGMKLKQQRSTQNTSYYKRTGNEWKPWRTGSTKPLVTFEARRPPTGRSLIRAWGPRTYSVQSHGLLRRKVKPHKTSELKFGRRSRLFCCLNLTSTVDSRFQPKASFTRQTLQFIRNREIHHKIQPFPRFQHFLSCTMITATVLSFGEKKWPLFSS